MKRILYILAALLVSAILFSCGGKDLSNEQKTELYSYYWESDVDIMQFTKNGKILRNFEFEHESDSRYTITDGKIKMYSESAPEDALIFDFEMSEDTLKIGELEYVKYQKIDETEKNSTDSGT